MTHCLITRKCHFMAHLFTSLDAIYVTRSAHQRGQRLHNNKGNMARPKVDPHRGLPHALALTDFLHS